MRGYNSTSYGTAFVDVYDDWYGDVTDVEATVSRIVDLIGTVGAVSAVGTVSAGTVLELGAGTGRLAVPLARAGLGVTAVDSSREMLDQLRVLDTDGLVEVVHGDMVDDLPDGPFTAALIAYNTIFNLLDNGAQQACFSAVAARLVPEGVFVVEAFVPESDTPAGSDISVRSMAVDRVVLSVSQTTPSSQQAEGQFIEITEAGGVRLRPWSVRWATPEQLDAMASTAGLVLDARHADMAGTPFDAESTQHVSVYRRPTR
ncbi:MAG: SAM-dependent methyltransferase [Ilumatobacter sp.]|jgi:SAM-dependent methyltransferase